MPTSVSILGLTFRVEERPRDELQGHGFGSAQLRTQILSISTEQHLEQARDSLLHEIIHMILQLLVLEDKKADERFVASFTTTLLDMLRRNPALTTYLFGDGVA